VEGGGEREEQEVPVLGRIQAHGLEDLGETLRALFSKLRRENLANERLFRFSA